MIWWRGNGLWALTFVALIVAGADKVLSTDKSISIGLGAAAIFVFLARAIWDEGASAFSIPVRIWPIGLAALSVWTWLEP